MTLLPTFTERAPSPLPVPPGKDNGLLWFYPLWGHHGAISALLRAENVLALSAPVDGTVSQITGLCLRDLRLLKVGEPTEAPLPTLCSEPDTVYRWASLALAGHLLRSAVSLVLRSGGTQGSILNA